MNYKVKKCRYCKYSSNKKHNVTRHEKSHALESLEKQLQEEKQKNKDLTQMNLKLQTENNLLMKLQPKGVKKEGTRGKARVLSANMLQIPLIFFT